MRMRSSIHFVHLIFSLLLLLSVKASYSEIVPIGLPLNWAARHGQVKIAAMLIEQGADINARDHFGNTPLHIGVRHKEMVALLLEKGAKVNTRNAFGNTPLHLGIENMELQIKAGGK